MMSSVVRCQGLLDAARFTGSQRTRRRSVSEPSPHLWPRPACRGSAPIETVPEPYVRLSVAELFLEFPDLVTSDDGQDYLARACGGPMPNGQWHGWIEFIPVGGDGIVLRSPRETTQPNRQDTEYWATGLAPVYLRGALHRALRPLPPRVLPPELKPAYHGPAPYFAESDLPVAKARDSILDPYSVYRNGELRLRGQLSALSVWHLANIAEAYSLVDGGVDPTRLSQPALVEMIVSAIKRRAGSPVST